MSNAASSYGRPLRVADTQIGLKPLEFESAPDERHAVLGQVDPAELRARACEVDVVGTGPDADLEYSLVLLRRSPRSPWMNGSASYRCRSISSKNSRTALWRIGVDRAARLGLPEVADGLLRRFCCPFTAATVPAHVCNRVTSGPGSRMPTLR